MKKKKMIAISSLLLLALLLAAGYLWIRSDVPEMEFHYSADEVYADWRLDKDGTVTVFGDGLLTWFKAEYSGRILELAQNGSIYAFLKWNLGKAYETFPARRMIIKDGATGLMEGEYSFHACDRLCEIIVDDSNPYFFSDNGVLFNKDKTVLLKYPENKRDGTYTVPGGVTEIAAEAFRNNAHLASVILPDGLEKVGAYAFCDCRRLSEVSLSEGLLCVGDYAFCNCRKLKSIAVPTSVQQIDPYAFGFYFGGWTKNYDMARVKAFKLISNDNAEAVKSYAQRYKIPIETGRTSK